MSESDDKHWIWDDMVLKPNHNSLLSEGLLKLSLAINNNQHPTVQRRTGRPPKRFTEFQKVVCRVIVSLAYFTDCKAHAVVWRQLGAENYTGTDVSLKQFNKVRQYLLDQGYLQVLKQGHDYGHRRNLQEFFPDITSVALKDAVRGHGQATRWVTTEAWHELCEEQLGLYAETILHHFVMPPTHPKPKTFTSPIVLRKPEPTPEQMKEIQNKPRFQEEVSMMEDLNNWLLSFSYSGVNFNGLQRHFHQRSAKHYGRLHAPFQNMKSGTRTHLIESGLLRINDCPVVEVDIASSQPLLLWGRYCFDKEAEWHDLYSVILERMSRINYPGLTRDLVKRDVVEIIGRKAAAARTHSKQDDPNKVQRQRLILERTPWLGGYVDDDDFTHGQLVHRESEALLMAMQTLRHEQIPSLPIHDSLLVGMVQPDADEVAVKALEQSWRQFFAPCPRATVKAKLR